MIFHVACAALLLAGKPSRVTDDQGCDKGLDASNELDGEIICKRNGVKTYEGMYSHGKRVGIAKTWRDDGKLGSVVHFEAGERSGLAEEYNRDGVIEEACEYKHDKKDGLCKLYDRDGKLREERRYTAGDQRGPFTSYFPSGKVREKGTLDSEGRRDGLYERFREDGKPESAQPYVHGKQHGTEKAWYPNGQLQSQTEWADGQRNGLTQRWHDNGQLSDVSCEKNGSMQQGTAACTGKIGPDVVSSYFPNGKVRHKTSYKSGKRDGEELTFNSEGTLLSSETWVLDVREGPEKTFDKAGKPRQERTWKAGKRDGVERTFFEEDGKVSEETQWKAGVAGDHTLWWMNGKKKLFETRNNELVSRQTWHDTGKLATEETLVAGNYRDARDGVAKRWNDQGTLLEESQWRKGERDGVTKLYFDPSGKPLSEETWVKGVRTARKEWDEKGALLKDEQFNADGSRK